MTDSSLLQNTPKSGGLLGSPVGRLRLIAMLEGLSFIALLFIAMPMKYAFGMPMAVRITGSLHGFFFILFLIAIPLAMRAKGWSIDKGARIFIAGLIPFGPFFIDRDLKKEQ